MASDLINMLHPIVVLKLTARELMAHLEDQFPNQEPVIIQTGKWYVARPTEEDNEPLDYILIYKIEANPDQGTEQHWHYIGLGLSDIHNITGFSISTPGLLPYPKAATQKNGFGFELTFRLKCNSSDSWQQEPPKWPCRVMQTLARYVFKSKISFAVGDHIEYKHPLDEEDESRIQHLLITNDSVLNIASTMQGPVEFLQLVGVCKEELDIGRQFSFVWLLDIMKRRESTGGPLLITDMRRGETIFEIDPEMKDKVESAITVMGSDMKGMSARHKYSSSTPQWFRHIEEKIPIERGHYFEGERFEQEPLMMSEATDPCHGSRVPSRMSVESESALKVENLELTDARFYDSIYLLLELELAKVLPVVLRGRLAHGRPFYIQSLKGDLLTTLIPEGYTQPSLVSRDRPYVRKGPWLQLFIPRELILHMIQTIDEQPIECFKNYSWHEFKFHLTIVGEIH